MARRRIGMLLENKNAARLSVARTFARERAAMTGKILDVTWGLVR